MGGGAFLAAVLESKEFTNVVIAWSLFASSLLIAFRSVVQKTRDNPLCSQCVAYVSNCAGAHILNFCYTFPKVWPFAPQENFFFPSTLVPLTDLGCIPINSYCKSHLSLLDLILNNVY